MNGPLESPAGRSHARADYPHSELTGAILGSALAVHGTFGFGFLESVYRRGLAAELRFRGIETMQEVSYELRHRNEGVGVYRADIVVAGLVIVEVKTGLIPDPIGPQLTLN